MNTYFSVIYNELEQQRIELINRVKELPTEKFNYSPAPGKWSIAQILTHILVAEQLSLQYMKKKAMGIEKAGDSGMVASLRLFILIISQRIPAIKFKAPKLVVANTPPAFPLVELISRWETHRIELKNFLEQISEKNKRKLIYKHLIAGRLDTRQAMVFFREHAIHHWPQIKRLLNQVS